METSEAFRGLRCTSCGTTVGVTQAARCPECDGALSPEYDLDRAPLDPASLARRRFSSMWRYAGVLPFVAAEAVTASEGATPLVEAPRLAEELGVSRVAIKDEGRNPTGTVHDRGMALAVTAARGHGADLVALASPGNSGQSAAAYAGRAGIRSYAFVPTRAPFPNKAMINVHGGEMRVGGGRFPDALAALDADLQSDWHSLQEFTTPYRHEGAKTVAYELAETLGDGIDGAEDGEVGVRGDVATLTWRAPDHVVVPAGSGELLVGIATGFRELVDLGLVDQVPPLYAAQPSGCAPIVSALESEADRVEPWAHPDTICGELELPDPAGGDLALAAVREAGGAGVAVDDEDALASAVTAAQHEAVEVGVAGGVALAGAWSLRDRFDADDTVVVLNTEAGTKHADLLRSHLMGQGV